MYEAILTLLSLQYTLPDFNNTQSTKDHCNSENAVPEIKSHRYKKCPQRYFPTVTKKNYAINSAYLSIKCEIFILFIKRLNTKIAIIAQNKPKRTSII